MKIVIVTRDAGPSNTFRIVADALLREPGCTVSCFLGDGKPLPEGSLEKIDEALQGADWLLTGISSSADRVVEERHAALQAKLLGVHTAVFSDIYGAYHRPWSAEVVRGANLLFITDESERDVARTYVRPEATIVASGNPYWATFFATANRDVVRGRLGLSEEKLVLISGSKELERNVGLFTDVVLAARRVERPLRLLFTAHPGADHPRELYRSVLRWSTHTAGFLESGISLSTQELFAAADLAVTGSGSTITLMAGCQRVPVIDHILPLDVLWWEELSGLSFWPPARISISRETRDVDGLSLGMHGLLNGGAQAMKAQQEAVLTPEKFAGAADAIVSALTS